MKTGGEYSIIDIQEGRGLISFSEEGSQKCAGIRKCLYSV